MNKKQMVTAYNDFLAMWNLTPLEAIVSSGGAMLMYDLRKAIDDIDVEVPQEAYDRIRAYWVEAGMTEFMYATYPEGKYEYFDYLDAEGCRISVHAIREKQETLDYNGVMIYKPKALLRQKESLLHLGRDKDLVDIAAIKAKFNI
jgi:hypothetical protein